MLLTIKELSQRIGVNIATLRKWTDTKRIPSTKTAGGHRRYDLNSVLIALNKTDISHRAVTMVYALSRDAQAIEKCQREAEMYCINNNFEYITIIDKTLNIIGNISFDGNSSFEEALRLILANRIRKVVVKSNTFLSFVKFNFLTLICKIKNIEFVDLSNKKERVDFQKEVPDILKLLKEAIKERNDEIIDYSVEEKIEKIERALNDN